jgi:hypothetical protein
MLKRAPDYTSFPACPARLGESGLDAFTILELSFFMRPIAFIPLILLSSCASTRHTEPAFREIFPHVKVDAAAKIVEFDGIVCIEAKDPNQPAGIPLECFVVGPTSGKEHESLILTQAKPSHIHAALLMLGLKNGKPGSFKWEGKERGLISIPPQGDAVRIEVSYADAPFRNLGNWAVHMNGAPLLPIGVTRQADAHWLFAGSFFAPFKGGEVYDADMTGIVAGLCTFGGEVLAFPQTISPDSSMVEPDFVASNTLVPPFGTVVKIRIQPR